MAYLSEVGWALPMFGPVGRGVLLALTCAFLALGILSIRTAMGQTEISGVAIFTATSTSLMFLFVLLAFRAILELVCHDAGNRYLGPKVMWYIVAWIAVFIVTVKPKDRDVRFFLYVIAVVFVLCAIFTTANAHSRVHEYEYTRTPTVETQTLKVKDTGKGEKLLVTACGDKVIFYPHSGKPMTIKFYDINSISLGDNSYPTLEKREVRTCWKKLYNGVESETYKVKDEYYVLVVPNYDLIPESVGLDCNGKNGSFGPQLPDS